MTFGKYIAVAAAFFLLVPAGAFAKDKTEHNLRLDEAVQVGSAQLQPGHYKVEWQGTGQAVPITFLQNGKTVLSTTGQVIEKDKPAAADQVLTRKMSNDQERLEELDFGHRKQALVFAPGAGM
ncbi:MAG TPA: hypothetical protein VF011_00840 [Terriglobales bacterium]